MDCSLPGSSTHGIFQARVLEWGAISRIVKSIVKESRLIIIRVWLEAGKGAIVHEHRKGYNCSCFIRWEYSWGELIGVRIQMFTQVPPKVSVYLHDAVKKSALCLRQKTWVNMEFSVYGEGIKILLFLVSEEFSWTNSELKGKKMLKTMEAN